MILIVLGLCEPFMAEPAFNRRSRDTLLFRFIREGMAKRMEAFHCLFPGSSLNLNPGCDSTGNQIILDHIVDLGIPFLQMQLRHFRKDIFTTPSLFPLLLQNFIQFRKNRNMDLRFGLLSDKRNLASCEIRSNCPAISGNAFKILPFQCQYIS